MSTYEITRRPDYELGNMSRVFQVLKAFGVHFFETQRTEADKLFCCIDFADQLIDSNRITPNNLLDFMIDSSKSFPEHIPRNALKILTFTRSLMFQRDITNKVEITAKKLFIVHSQLQKTVSPKEYVMLTKQEGTLHAYLGIFFYEEIFTSKAKGFIIEANIVGNLADNLLDLQEDKIDGKISINAENFGLKLRLKIAMLISVFKLCILYPKKSELPQLVQKYVKYALTKRG